MADGAAEHSESAQPPHPSPQPHMFLNDGVSPDSPGSSATDYFPVKPAVDSITSAIFFERAS